jgi:hypothetical protein
LYCVSFLLLHGLKVYTNIGYLSNPSNQVHAGISPVFCSAYCVDIGLAVLFNSAYGPKFTQEFCPLVSDVAAGNASGENILA